MTTTVQLSKFYTLTYSALKAEVRQLSWDQVPGKNKLRKFFVRSNWQEFIVSVNVSGSGAKGGVFFLECDVLDPADLQKAVGDAARAGQVWKQLVADGLITEQGFKSAAGRAGTLPQAAAYANSRTAVAQLLKQSKVERSFVVKGAEEPARTLFAEYVLSRIGKAKIPKSLVLNVDPMRPANAGNPSEGMMMLQILRDKRSAKADARRYARCLAYLDDGKGTSSSTVSYLVVQKLIKGDQLPIYEGILAEAETFMEKWKLKITRNSFFADPAFQETRSDGTFVVSDDDVAKLVSDLSNQKCISDAGIVTKDYATNLANVTNVPAGKGADVQRILKASYDALQANGLAFTATSSEVLFDELDAGLQKAPANSLLKQDFQPLRARQAQKMQTLERILGDGAKMFNTGAIILADLVIGNGDRFESMNVENCFYTDKVRTLPAGAGADEIEHAKVSSPIACIDNEATMQAYERRRTFVDAAGTKHTEGFANRDQYVTDLLANGVPELWGSSAPLPEGYVMAHSARLRYMLDGKWFSKAFLTAFSARMPECVRNQMSANLWDKTGAKPAPGPLWTAAEAKISEGLCDTLVRLQKTHLYEFRDVYRALLRQYGRSSNFDFAAFEVRYRFLRRMVVSRPATLVPYDFNAIKTDIINRLDTRSGGTGLSPTIRAALISAAAPAILQQEQVSLDQVTEVLTMLSVRRQEAMIPNPFGALGHGLHFGKLPEAEKQARLAAVQENGAGYEKRLQAVICAIVARFAAEYLREARGSLTHVYVPASIAYRQACFNAEQFSRAKLYKDDGGTTTKRLRRQLLADYSLQAYATAGAGGT